MNFAESLNKNQGILCIIYNNYRECMALFTEVMLWTMTSKFKCSSRVCTVIIFTTPMINSSMDCQLFWPWVVWQVDLSGTRETGFVSPGSSFSAWLSRVLKLYDTCDKIFVVEINLCTSNAFYSWGLQPIMHQLTASVSVIAASSNQLADQLAKGFITVISLVTQNMLFRNLWTAHQL